MKHFQHTLSFPALDLLRLPPASRFGTPCRFSIFSQVSPVYHLYDNFSCIFNFPWPPLCRFVAEGTLPPSCPPLLTLSCSGFLDPPSFLFCFIRILHPIFSGLSCLFLFQLLFIQYTTARFFPPPFPFFFFLYF